MLSASKWTGMMTHVRLIFVFVVCLSGVAYAGESPQITSLAVDNPSRLLFVGNSYLYYNNSLHDHLFRMVVSAGLYDQADMTIKSVTINGARLRHHDVESYLKPNALGSDEPFQVVVLQGHSTAALTDDHRAQFADSVRQYAQFIRRQGGEVILYMTPAYVYPHKLQRSDMIRDIESLYTTVGNEVDALIIPVGLAFEEAYRRRPNIRLHEAYDGTHPTLLGTYLGTATVFACLYNQSPVGNSYDYFGEIDTDTRVFLQNVAQDVATKFCQHAS
ncbi:MAG: hypothetical protein OXI60_08715 [Acidiferrobacterales bacterium]|nr:hypothetical protein [Acidiferrobacterales bacterium]